MTVIQAAVTVLRDAKAPMSAADILAAIESRDLYAFAAKNPLDVVRSQLRRHSEGYPKAAAAAKPVVRRVARDMYALIG